MRAFQAGLTAVASGFIRLRAHKLSAAVPADKFYQALIVILILILKRVKLYENKRRILFH